MPKYKRIAQDIIEKIESSIYTVGNRIPSEADLMVEYNSSRDTIRKAIEILVNSGYILKIHGKPSIVLDINKFDFSIANVHSFKEVANSLSNKITSKVVHLERCKVKDINNMLKLPLNAYYWHIQRIRIIDDLKIIFDEDYLMDTDNMALTIEILENSMYEYLENELKLNISYASKEVTVEAINELDIKYLDLNDFNMMAVIKSYSYLDKGILFQYTQSRHRPDKFKFNTFARRYK